MNSLSILAGAFTDMIPPLSEMHLPFILIVGTALGILGALFIKCIICKIVAFCKYHSDGLITISQILGVCLVLALFIWAIVWITGFPSGFDKGDIVVIECNDIRNSVEAFKYNGCVGELVKGRIGGTVQIKLFYNPDAKDCNINKTLFDVDIKNIRIITDKEAKDIATKID